MHVNKLARSEEREERKEDDLRITVVGAGVVGSYFGGHLAHAGENVVFLDRGANLQAIREHGLQVDDVDGNFLVCPAQATDDPTTVDSVDVVLRAVRGWQVPGAIETMRPMMGPDTFAVPLCDGVEAPGQVAAAFGERRVVGGTYGTEAGTGRHWCLQKDKIGRIRLLEANMATTDSVG